MLYVKESRYGYPEQIHIIQGNGWHVEFNVYANCGYFIVGREKIGEHNKHNYKICDKCSKIQEIINQ